MKSCVFHCCCWEGRTPYYHDVWISTSCNLLPHMTIFPRECLSNNKCMDVFLERFLRVHQMVGSTKCYMRNSLICIDNLLFKFSQFCLLKMGIHLIYLFLRLKRLMNVIFPYLVSQHIPLQPLDVGVLTSFKENFQKACHHFYKLGWVVSDQGITALVAEAWPVSMMLVSFIKNVAFIYSILERWNIKCLKYQPSNWLFQ